MTGAPGTRAIEAVMRRAIELSQRGPAWGVNPQVGCVLLAPDGTTLAEGWHRGAGTPHAEVDALSNLTRPGDARGATAVVTLEPCNHTGRTGPCSEALIEAGVSTVYFAVSDPGCLSGGGAERLAQAGIAVHEGLPQLEVAANHELQREVESSIRPWLTATRLRRPFVTVKWAASLDGRAAAADGSSQWITGEEARADVHVRRSRHDAIVVGTATAWADDPTLTARRPDGTLLPHQPAPVVIGERGVSVNARLHGHPLPLIEYRTHDLAAVLADLFDRGMRSVFVEGGPTLASALLAAGLVDDVVVYLAPVLLGGPQLAVTDLGIGSMADARRLELVSVDLLGPDLRLVLRPIRSDTAPDPAVAAAIADPLTPELVEPHTRTPEGEPLVHRNH